MDDELTPQEVTTLYALLQRAIESGQLTVNGEEDGLPAAGVGGRAVRLLKWPDAEVLDAAGNHTGRHRDELLVCLDEAAVKYMYTGKAADGAAMLVR
jgi:hypothetical protein